MKMIERLRLPPTRPWEVVDDSDEDSQPLEGSFEPKSYKERDIQETEYSDFLIRSSGDLTMLTLKDLSRTLHSESRPSEETRTDRETKEENLKKRERNMI